MVSPNMKMRALPRLAGASPLERVRRHLGQSWLRLFVHDELQRQDSREEEHDE